MAPSRPVRSMAERSGCTLGASGPISCGRGTDTMAGDTNDPRRQRLVTFKWLRGGLIGQFSINAQLWGAIEWSGKRNAWCVEDACGRCLAHEPSICGQAAARDAAVELAQAMIRDGPYAKPR